MPEARSRSTSLEMAEHDSEQSRGGAGDAGSGGFAVASRGDDLVCPGGREHVGGHRSGSEVARPTSRSPGKDLDMGKYQVTPAGVPANK